MPTLPEVGTPILQAPIAEGSRDQHMVLNMGIAASVDARRAEAGSGD